MGRPLNLVGDKTMRLTPNKQHTKKGKRVLMKSEKERCEKNHENFTRRSSWKKERFGKHKTD